MIGRDQKVVAVVAAAVPGGGDFRSKLSATRDSGGYLGLPGAILWLALATAVHADITGTVTLVGKPNSHDETFVAQASGCGESPVRHTENWKVGPKGELGDVVVWIVDPKGLPQDQVMKVIAVKQL